MLKPEGSPYPSRHLTIGSKSMKVLAIGRPGRATGALCCAGLLLMAATTTAQPSKTRSAEPQPARVAAKVLKRPLLRSGRIQFCLKKLGRYDGRINNRMTALTERALRRLRDDFEIKADDVSQDWALHAVLWRQCREHWTRDGGALDRFGFAAMASADQRNRVVPSSTSADIALAANKPVPAPAPPPTNHICLTPELRDLVARAHGRRVDVAACEAPCLPLPTQVDRDDAPAYERRHGFSWCAACVPFAGELRLDDIVRIEKAGNITLCPDPRRQLIRSTAATGAGPATEAMRGIRGLFRRDIRAGEAGNALAVLVSVADYGNGLPPRPRAERDAAAMQAVLVERLGFRSDRVLEIKNPTRAELDGVFGRAGAPRGLLADRLKDTPDAPILIYFSGLGAISDDEGEAYLLPADALPHRERATAFALDTFYQNLTRLGTGPVTVILEADFGSDPAGPAISPNAPSGRGGALPQAAARQLLVISATERDQRPLEDRESGLSLFTRHLVEGLSGHADLAPIGNNDGSLDTVEAFAFAAARTSFAARKLTGLLQRPMISHGRSVPLARLGGPRR